MPGWLARRLFLHGGRCAAWTGHVRAAGMAAKRGGEGGGPAKPSKRPCTPDLSFIALTQTPPRTPSPGSPELDFSDFIIIDTNPTPVPDVSYIPLPPGAPRRCRGTVDVGDIEVVYEGPVVRSGGRKRGGVSGRSGPLVGIRRGIKTQVRAPPVEEVVVVVGECPEVEVIEVVDSEAEGVVSDGDGSVVVGGDSDGSVVVGGGDSDGSVVSGGGGSDGSVVCGGGDSVGSSSSVVGVEVVEAMVEALVEEEQVEGEQVEGEQVKCGSDSDSSGDGGDGDGVKVDISGNGFVSLGPKSVASLTNTAIDLTDAVLKRRRQMERLRPWDHTPLGQRVSRRGMPRGAVEMTVVSYNVLAQSLLRDNPVLYRDCDAEQLSWEYRWALLQHEVKALHPDVLLLQEVEAAHYHSHYLPWLAAHGYNGLYKKRTGTKGDGCAIFHLTEHWTLAEHVSVEYRQPQAPDILDRDNVGLVARLTPRGAGASASGVCVATTHLLYNPRRHDVKLAQAALLLTELDRLCYAGPGIGGAPRYIPAVLTGDLNAEPHAALLSFLLEGRLHYQGLHARTLTRHGHYGQELGLDFLPPALGITGACQHASLAQGRWLEGQRGPIFSMTDKRRLEEALIHLHHSDRPTPAATPALNHNTVHCPGWLTHNFHLSSVYRGGGGRGGGWGGVSTFQNRWCCVDYLMYSRSRLANGQAVEGPLRLLSSLALPDAKTAAIFSPMPSDVCPSDHFPLAARFMLEQ